jgi:iron complex transport system substrate-binding protein
VREAELPGDWVPSGRDEAFALRFADGRSGRAVLGLGRQRVDAVGASDPDLVHAVRCWIAARGGRATNLATEGGVVLDAAAFGPADLGDAPTGTPMRLVTLAPSNAEIVDALHCFDRVVACEDSSDHPPRVAELPRLGPDLGPDLDRVAALQPGLVLSSLTVPGMERVVTGLRARGVPQLVLAPRSLAEVMDDLRRVGRALGVDERAEAVVADLDRQRCELESRCPAVPVRVYLEWWPRPMFTPGVDCYSNELVALAGGVNVFADRPGSSIEISPADLLAADPQICFVSWCGVAEAKLDPGHLIRREGLEPLAAARSGHVYRLDERFSGRPGPRMLEASRRMAAAIRDAFGPG